MILASRRARRRAVTLVEGAVSTLIVAILLVSALNTVGAAQSGRRLGTERLRAQFLAHELMSEILAKAYEDPSGPGLLGLDPTETLGFNRTAFDDIDDYSDLRDAPPRYADGTAIAGFDARWQRRVTVAYADPQQPKNSSNVDQGVKRVTIDVTCDGRALATLTAIRTRAWLAGGGP